MIVVQTISLDDSTVGVMTYGSSFRCVTLELPNKDNNSNVSCIPRGTYVCEKWTSPSKGECLRILDVPNRTDVLVHAGNYTSQILGCCLVGDSLTDMNADGILDVTNSKKTLEKLLAAIPDRRTKIMFI